MKTQTEIQIIAKNGTDIPIDKKEVMLIKSAWNWKSSRVVIEIDNQDYEVGASQLRKAIDNATNCE